MQEGEDGGQGRGDGAGDPGGKEEMGKAMPIVRPAAT